MKILFFNTFYFPIVSGGAEYTMKIIVEGLKNIGYDVVVASLQSKLKKTELSYVDGVKVYRCIVHNVDNEIEGNLSKFKRKIWNLFDIFNLYQIKEVKYVFDIEKPDIVFCHNIVGWSSSLLWYLKHRNVKVIQVLHDLNMLCHLNMFKNGNSCRYRCINCKINRGIHKFLSCKIDGSAFISNYMKNRFSENGYFSSSKQLVIYNSRIINPVDKQHCSVKTFGFLGTVKAYKGVELLIKEFHSLSIDANLLIGGRCDNDYKDKLLSISDKDNRIFFLGPVDSQSFYKKIDVLVVPSLWEEPLGMVAVEALANNVPVITSGYGGLSEIVKDEYNGLIFNQKKNELRLSSCIQKLYDNNILFSKLRNSARSSISTFLDPSRQISQYDLLIRQVLCLE